jgi:Transposase IS116/IS110/IS902 family
VTIANSSGNKAPLGGITKAGNRYLRQMPVVGAMVVNRHAERNGARRPRIVQLLARTATKLAAIALGMPDHSSMTFSNGLSATTVISLSRWWKSHSNTAWFA